MGAPPPWLGVKSPANRTTVDAFRLLVHEGEAEVIALAAESGWRVILDDRKARRLAARLGLKVIGTVGVLLRAKRSGIIPAIEPFITSLERAGFRMDTDLKVEALRLAGE
jgi:predicted nucleic acid-binding protein